MLAKINGRALKQKSARDWWSWADKLHCRILYTLYTVQCKPSGIRRNTNTDCTKLNKHTHSLTHARNFRLYILVHTVHSILTYCSAAYYRFARIPFHIQFTKPPAQTGTVHISLAQQIGIFDHIKIDVRANLNQQSSFTFLCLDDVVTGNLKLV